MAASLPMTLHYRVECTGCCYGCVSSLPPLDTSFVPIAGWSVLNGCCCACVLWPSAPLQQDKSLQTLRVRSSGKRYGTLQLSKHPRHCHMHPRHCHMHPRHCHMHPRHCHMHPRHCHMHPQALSHAPPGTVTCTPGMFLHCHMHPRGVPALSHAPQGCSCTVTCTPGMFLHCHMHPRDVPALSHRWTIRTKGCHFRPQG